MSGLTAARMLRRKSEGSIWLEPADSSVWPRAIPGGPTKHHLRAPSCGKASSETRSPSHGTSSTRTPSQSRGVSKQSTGSRRPSRRPGDSAKKHLEIPETVTKQISMPNLDDTKVQALLLSRELHLDFHEVRSILQHLQEEKAKLPPTGVELPTFHEALLRVLGTEAITPELLQDAYGRCDAARGPINPRVFMSWYRDHVFAINHQPSTAQKSADDVTLELAKKHHCLCIDVDKVKLKYDNYDTDKSGVIEYDEFEMMMYKLLRCSSKDDLPTNRLQRFWQEVDKDGNGSVDFAEFVDWYFKYFALAHESGPIEAFYASFMPDVQRGNTLEALSGSTESLSRNSSPVAEITKEPSPFPSDSANQRRMTIA
mmetsp:Transcript_772/g.1465  ORF Transcript_772/g.1465 Transcript_772/m.1465 type:complete len:370 (+) Transcript_772:81-1190(+)